MFQAHARTTPHDRLLWQLRQVHESPAIHTRKLPRRAPVQEEVHDLVAGETPCAQRENRWGSSGLARIAHRPNRKRRKIRARSSRNDGLITTLLPRVVCDPLVPQIDCNALECNLRGSQRLPKADHRVGRVADDRATQCLPSTGLALASDHRQDFGDEFAANESILLNRPDKFATGIERTSTKWLKARQENSHPRTVAQEKSMWENASQPVPTLPRRPRPTE